jgi:dsRNA-specific ribonuclease
MEKYIDITTMIVYDDNFKDQLMRYFQKNYEGQLPRYELKETINVKNNDGIITKRFHMVVYNIEGEIIGSGIQKNKRDAEQSAAKEALSYYGIVHKF